MEGFNLNSFGVSEGFEWRECYSDYLFVYFVYIVFFVRYLFIFGSCFLYYWLFFVEVF